MSKSSGKNWAIAAFAIVPAANKALPKFLNDTESNQVKIMEPHKNSQMLWLAKGDFTDQIIDYNRVVIDNLDQGIYYQEIGWEHNI